jgi:hypothetical protein
MTTNNPVIEILTLNLRRAVAGKFHQLYAAESIPLQRKFNIEVIDYGPSEHDENIYYVVRHFKSSDDRQKLQDAFYNSDEWQKGPRSAVLAMIETLTAVVISTDTFKEWSDAIMNKSSV